MTLAAATASSSQAAVTQPRSIQPAAIEAYAADHGGTLEHAREALELQEQASSTQLEGEVRGALGSSYGAMWFDNRADQLVVGVGPGGSVAAAEAILEKNGIAGRVEQVEWTGSTAKEEVRLLHQRLLPYIAGAEVRVGFGEGVIVEVATGASDAAKQAVTTVAAEPTVGPGAGLSQNVVRPQVVTSSSHFFGLPTPAKTVYKAPGLGSPLIAGEEYQNINYGECTLGFEGTSSIYHTGSYFLTAGHCIETNRTREACKEWTEAGGKENKLGWGIKCSNFGYDVGGTKDGYGDFGVLQDTETSKWPAAPEFLAWASGKEGFEVGPPIEPKAGNSVCHTGFGSDIFYVGQSCGTIIRAEIVKYGGAEMWEWLVEGTTLCSHTGDSGGPVYSGADGAVGIFDAESNDGCNVATWFTSAKLAAEAQSFEIL